jgi:7-carboxy-7-deazaguanine synthase (Cx14CxxC type)
VGGGRFETEDSLAAAIEGVWNGDGSNRFVVFTGGEPILQLDEALIDAVHRRGFEIAVETNGTLPVPIGVDWICVSPKRDAPLRQRSGSELKLVFPQGDDTFGLLDLQFDHYWIQPMDGPEKEANTQAAIEFCLNNPKWRLSIQTHKLLGIP